MPLSEAARARAIKRGPGFWGFLVAHHWPGQLSRCYRIWLGRRPVWFCARCAGLYPVLALVLTVLLFLRPAPGRLDLVWLFLLPLPALVDWARSRLTPWEGANWLRSLTGAMLGVSLARTVQLNMVDPGHWLVVAQLGSLVAIVLAVEVWARLRAARQRPAAGDGP